MTAGLRGCRLDAGLDGGLSDLAGLRGWPALARVHPADGQELIAWRLGQ
jgi:hypothetical protein